MIPTGNTSEIVQKYYEYLYTHYIQGIPTSRTGILWTGPLFIFFWAVILIGFFYLYARYLQKVHRERGELYGAASFAGSILERIGRIAPFSIIVWLLIIGVAIYYIVVQIMYGYLY